MPKRPDFTLKLSIKNIEDFSPDAIVRSPRSCRSQDVIRACQNITLETITQGTPAEAIAIAHFISIDFFGLAHSTGLYNRQIKLWEALAKTSRIEIYLSSKGFFNKTLLPEFDMILLDHKSRLLAMSHYARPESPGDHYDYLRKTNEFLQRAGLKQGFAGLFLCYQAPFPPNVLEHVRKKTRADDALSRYESVWPKLGTPINLLEIEETTNTHHVVRLLHPSLPKRQITFSP